MKRLWRKFRTRRLRGWNPLYSPSIAFHDGMLDIREAFLEGMRETQEVLDRGDPEGTEAYYRELFERILQHHGRSAGIRIGNTIYFPAPYDPITLPEDEWIEED